MLYNFIAPVNICMIEYPNVWPLPYGINLRLDNTIEHNYAIKRSQTDCWQIRLHEYDMVFIHAMQTGWIDHQTFVLRAWLSDEPAGQNIIPVKYNMGLNIHLSAIANTWLFYKSNLDFIDYEHHIGTKFGICKHKIYYFNIQNTSNIDDGYFLKFSYDGPCGKLII